MNGLARCCKALLTTLGGLAFVAACGGGGGGGSDPVGGVPPLSAGVAAAGLTTVVVTPANATVPSGAPQQYVATASFTDGSSRDVTAVSVWTSASTAAASVDSDTGLAVGVSPGTTVISAAFGGQGGLATLTVTAVGLQSVSIAPVNASIAGGLTRQFSVIGAYADGTTRNLSAVSSFTSSAPAFATIGVSSGLATAVTAGTSVITASAGGISASTNLTVTAATLVSIALTPVAPTLPSGTTQQFVVTGTYTDNTVVDVSAAAAYASATPSVATVGASTGLATGVSPGTTVISAAFGGQSGSAALTVTAAVLQSVSIAPVNASVASGLTRQFSVIGAYSDGTTRDLSSVSSFSSSAPAFATIGASSGLASAVTTGTSVITASAGGMNSSTSLNVTAATLVSIALTPATPTLPNGTTQQLVVSGTYTDNTVVDVSTSAAYTSATRSVATVGASSGLVTGVSQGSALITATFGGRTASTGVTVAAATLVSIAVTPVNPSVVSGSTQQLSATGTYSDATTAALTTSVTWSSSSPVVATIVSSGIATGQSVGVSTISATLSGVSSSTTLTVTAPPIITVALGGATNFGLLAGTSITNNAGGTTLVTGDVGSPSQTVDPTQAAGYTNYKSGAILTTALSDLQTAVNDANARPCTSTIPGAFNLGGQNVSPGVYCFTGAVTLTGTLTLNGPGFYLFRTATTLGTTANSSVALINGATADNLFFAPAGAAVLGANSAFQGTLLMGTGAVTIGDNATILNGRVLTGAAVTMSNNQITKP